MHVCTGDIVPQPELVRKRDCNADPRGTLRRVAELQAFVPLQVVSLTTAIGTVYQVRSAAMPADVALRLLGSMTAGGVKDIMLAGKAARR